MVLKKKFYTCLVAFVLCICAACYSQDAAQQEQTLTELSSTIYNKLIDLKKNSAIVTEQLIQLSENLELSQAEAQQWKEQSMNLSNSLKSINDELNDCYTTIIKYKQKIQLQTKVIVIILIIVLIRLIAMTIGYILYIKRVRVPRWIDILL